MDDDDHGDDNGRIKTEEESLLTLISSAIQPNQLKKEYLSVLSNLLYWIPTCLKSKWEKSANVTLFCTRVLKGWMLQISPRWDESRSSSATRC